MHELKMLATSMYVSKQLSVCEGMFPATLKFQLHRYSPPVGGVGYAEQKLLCKSPTV